MEFLLSDDCLPIGGYSVWSTFQEYNVNETHIYNESVQSPNELILATTSMDTSCLFHQNVCRGGNANMAGLVGWMAAIEALSRIKDVLNEANITKMDKQIVFAAFEGESYDLVGSRKFVDDLQNGSFRCTQTMTVSENGYGCWKPYASSLDFKKLNFSKIGGVVELSQIGMAQQNENGQIARTLYAHYERPMGERTASMVADAKHIASSISSEQSMGFGVETANSSDLPGTPPSAFWSFLNGNVDGSPSSLSMPGIVLSDHSEEYRNKWYHSVYDSYFNALNLEQICMASTLYARLLYKISLKEPDKDYNESFVANKVNADCLLVEQLLECLLLDMGCDLVSSFAPKSRDSSPSHYSSVHIIVEDDDIHGTPKFVFRFIANLTRSSQETFGPCSRNMDCSNKARKRRVCSFDAAKHGKYCMESKTYFHAAVDPNLSFDYDDKVNLNRWHLKSDNVSSLIFTESMWSSNIGTRFYEKESDQTQIVMLVAGILMLSLNMVLTWRFKVYCKHKFPYLSRG